MGIKLTAHIKETTEITFMSAGRKDYKDLLRHYFDNENFGATAQDNGLPSQNSRSCQGEGDQKV